MAAPSGSDSSKDESSLVIELIEGGSEIAGAATGAAIGLVGGPVGVVGGAAAGAALVRVMKRVGADLQRRMLGPREQVRIGAAAAYAGAKIQSYLQSGEIPREDGFFSGAGKERPPADELLEGVLLKARDSYEEKKVPLLGNLYANIAFIPDVSPALSNHLISLAGRLTYQQLVALAVARDDANRLRLRQKDFRGDQKAIGALGITGVGALTSLYELYQQGLLNGGEEAWIGVGDVNPAAMRAQGAGDLLAKLMELESIPLEDREEFYRLFPVISGLENQPTQ